MRTTLAVSLSILLVAPLLASVSQVTISPDEGAPFELSEPPEAVRILFPGLSFDPGVRLLDTTGDEVPATVFEGDLSERVIVPEEPLPAGQYTVDFPGLDVVRTFTIGPDVYPPKLLTAAPEPLERDATLALRFTEPITATGVTKDTVKVWDVSGDEQVRVSGKLHVESEGTRLTFTPVGWPGFTPEARFEVEIDGGAVT
ncbi:MAG: hypothetical protein ACYS99_13705, partial [Planctomycetota bacterium]